MAAGLKPGGGGGGGGGGEGDHSANQVLLARRMGTTVLIRYYLLEGRRPQC